MFARFFRFYVNSLLSHRSIDGLLAWRDGVTTSTPGTLFNWYEWWTPTRTG